MKSNQKISGDKFRIYITKFRFIVLLIFVSIISMGCEKNPIEVEIDNNERIEVEILGIDLGDYDEEVYSSTMTLPDSLYDFEGNGYYINQQIVEYVDNIEIFFGQEILSSSSSELYCYALITKNGNTSLRKKDADDIIYQE